MGSFVINTLTEWQPTDLVEKFKDGVGELTLRQLPALLLPTTYKVGRGRGAKVVHHTIQECSLAFFDHKPPGINMVEYLHEAKACKPYRYILTLGNDQSVFQAFVIIAGQTLEQEALLLLYC